MDVVFSLPAAGRSDITFARPYPYSGPHLHWSMIVSAEPSPDRADMRCRAVGLNRTAAQVILARLSAPVLQADLSRSGPDLRLGGTLHRDS